MIKIKRSNELSKNPRRPHLRNLKEKQTYNKTLKINVFLSQTYICSSSVQRVYFLFA